MPECAICLTFGEDPRPATGSVGLITNIASLTEAALDHFGYSAEGQHIIVAACPEHVVDVYRERLPNVRMAWRLGDGPTLSHQNRAAVSASQA